MTKAKKSGKETDPRGQLMPNCPQNSLFKLKVWKLDGREYHLFSNDFEKEREVFSQTYGRYMIQAMHQKAGANIFLVFNGFKYLEEHVNKVCAQGNLRYAQLYCNQIREPNPKVSIDPVPILLCNFANPATEQAEIE